MSNAEEEIKSLVCELCRQFFDAGWVTGTGGSISIRHGEKIFMTPSGVQKERIKPDELFAVDIKGEVTHCPAQKENCRVPKLSDCAPLFLHAYQQRNAGAVLHSHAVCCNMVTSLFEGLSEFRISHQEMIKGIDGHGYFDELVVPIIENTAFEHELADSLGTAITKYPKACAVLVRRHGMYVWGNSWEQAKRHGECLHYLFELALNMRRMGMDFNTAPLAAVGSKRLYSDETMNKRPRVGANGLISTTVSPKLILLDIEGTTTDIKFVKQTLFPYSTEKLPAYIEETWADPLTVSIVKQLRDIALKQNYPNAPTSLLGNDPITADVVVEYCLWCIKEDKKIPPLKTLQGMIWEAGYKSGTLVGGVYRDVPAFLKRKSDQGVRICIYSSGSRRAQQLLFSYSEYGDLSSYLSGYFDTAVGPKGSASSYRDILLTLGIPVDKASEVMFVTDVVSEAKAATEAGMQTRLSMRPGNAPVPENHGFEEITSFDHL